MHRLAQILKLHPMTHLSEREMEILSLLKTGMSQKQIARNVYTSKRVVEYTIQSLCTRFNCKKAIQLVSIAYEHGILPVQQIPSHGTSHGNPTVSQINAENNGNKA
jgi:DNA-binding NarL/FixJ family response regulator